jgi:multidrug efflux pump subunit AcrB
VTKIVEKRVMKVLGDSNRVVESVVANVALGASENMLTDFGTIANKSKISVNFVEFDKRHGAETLPYMEKFREAVKGIPGADITVDKRAMGPPTGKPVNIEIYGYDLEELVETSSRLITFIDSLNIPGIEKLKTDFEKKKPELVVEIDRERANHENLSTGQIGMEISTAILGKEVSKFRDGEDQYPIELRYNKYIRDDNERLMNLKVTYRDMATGFIRQLPISSVANVVYQNTYGGITRENAKRMITVYSNVLTGYNSNQIIPKIKKALPSFHTSENIDIKITGEQEDQKDTMSFLGKAMLLSLFLILFILITQFNSMLKPLIIISEVIFSIVGVLLGYMIFGLTFSIIMTGMGLVALAGIVVRNGILLVEFTDVLKARGLKTRNAIIQGGKTRITPVLLTATATILGLIPLAIGLNIDFISMFTQLNPHIHFGGDNVAFFGTLAWTIIFGLSFATILTLVFIPIMYYITYVVIVNRKRNRSNRLARGRM